MSLVTASSASFVENSNYSVCCCDSAMTCCIGLLWPPYEIGQAIIFLPCGFFLLSSFFSSPNLSGRRLDVYHTSTHGVALVQI